MVENRSVFNQSTGHQNVVSNVDSSFYTSSLKDTVFSFMAELKPINQATCYGSNSIPAKLARTSEKRKGIDLFSDDAIPQKYYFCEAAMANHFAQMNLTLPVNATKITHNNNNIPPITAAQDIYQNLSLCTNRKANTENVSEGEDESDEDGHDNGSLLRFSEDLKDHLRCSRINPTDAFLKGLLSSEPSLAIVPFDPDRFKSLLPSDSTNQSSQENSEISVLPSGQLIYSPDIFSSSTSAIDHPVFMEIDSEFPG
ncbi:unnamed protein product [Heterobilharzia americana]|nr:unnamed protein product [Heterobilharzia americana]